MSEVKKQRLLKLTFLNGEGNKWQKREDIKEEKKQHQNQI